MGGSTWNNPDSPEAAGATKNSVFVDGFRQADNAKLSLLDTALRGAGNGLQQQCLMPLLSIPGAS